MSSSNAPDFVYKHGEKSAVKVSGLRLPRAPYYSQNITKNIKNVVGSSTNEYDIPWITDNDAIFHSAYMYKRHKLSLDQGIRRSEIINYNNHYEKQNLMRKLACNGNKKMNSYQQCCDPRVTFLVKNSKQINSVSVPDSSMNKTTFNCTEPYLSKTKTANSSGSSFLNQIPLPPVTTMPSQSLFIQDPGDFISLKPVDQLDHQNNEHARTDLSHGMPGSVNYFNNESVQFQARSSLCYRNNNTVSSTNHLTDRKYSAPDYLISDRRPNAMDNSFDPHTINTVPEMYIPFSNGDESLPQSSAVNTNARNSIPYLKQTMPFFYFNNAGSVSTESRNVNTCPQFCFPYSNNIPHSAMPSEQYNGSIADEYILLPQQQLINDGVPYYYPPERNVLQQQQSSNNDRDNDLATTVEVTSRALDEEDTVLSPIHLSDVNDTHTTHCTTDADTEIRIVGKFTVTSSSMEESRGQDGDQDRISPVEVARQLSNTSSGQPRSRFKKTRIRETVERWHSNGLSTYDCRFKIIPIKIMALQNKTLDGVPDDHLRNLCDNCQSHDCSFRCPNSKYYSNDLLFWHNGERTSICGKSDYDTENYYCQFHAKFFQLLNQNQNMSLSNFVPQHSNVTNGALSLSIDQTTHAIFVTSPDIENLALNIDTRVAQNDASSAPPASPSIHNSSFEYSIPCPAKSDVSMVVLRCQTPILISSISKLGSYTNDSMTRRHRSPSGMSIESDSTSMVGHPIFVTHSNSLVELLQNSPTNRENLVFPIPPTSYTLGMGHGDGCFTNDASYNGPDSLYTIEQIPQILYSVPQKVKVSPTTNSYCIPTSDQLDNSDHLEDCPLSSNVVHELDHSLNSLKSLIHNLVQSEKQPLIDEISILHDNNRTLRAELAHLQKRSEYLESILRANKISIENTSLPNLCSEGVHDRRQNSDPECVYDCDS